MCQTFVYWANIPGPLLVLPLYAPRLRKGSVTRMGIKNIRIAVLVVFALALLGYLVGFLSSKFDLRPQVESRFLPPESEEEARTRNRVAWRKYRRLRVLFPLAFLSWLPYAGVLGAVFSLFHWTGKAWGVVWAALADQIGFSPATA
jgi:hypothetical protein